MSVTILNTAVAPTDKIVLMLQINHNKCLTQCMTTVPSYITVSQNKHQLSHFTLQACEISTF